MRKDMIRALSGSSSSARGGGGGASFEEGDKVEAKYRGRSKLYKGRITRDRGDGTFDIDYDDGEKETRVAEELIKPLDAEDDDRSGRNSGRSGRGQLREGAKVGRNTEDAVSCIRGG